MSKGFNSVIFDFDSIVDKELSVIKFLRGEYKDTAIGWFDKNKVICADDEYIRFHRCYKKESIFKSIIIDDSMKNNSDQIMNLIFDRDQADIFNHGYAYNTSMINLISAYKKAGNGTIRTAIRCDNEDQKKYIESIMDTDILVKPRKDVDMSKYARLIVGRYTSALEYILNEPKSILVLNFSENFSKDDFTLLNPELVIKLGDIHDIGVISAFRDINNEC